MVTRNDIRKAVNEQKKEYKENAKFGIYAYPGKQIYQDWIDNAKKELGI